MHLYHWIFPPEQSQIRSQPFDALWTNIRKMFLLNCMPLRFRDGMNYANSVVYRLMACNSDKGFFSKVQSLFQGWYEPEPFTHCKINYVFLKALNNHFPNYLSSLFFALCVPMPQKTCNTTKQIKLMANFCLVCGKFHLATVTSGEDDDGTQ